jgi:hypothetical protein
MKNLFILLITIMFISCSNDNAPKLADIMGTSVNIHLKNSSGVDILGGEMYPKNTIITKFLVDGTEQNPGNGLNPIFVNENNLNYIKIPINNTSSTEFPITYIHWNSKETDTLKAKFRRGNGVDGNYIVCEKVWINDVLVWEVTVQGQVNNDITIVK